MSKIFVYRRVSTADQNLDRQLPDFEADLALEEKVSAKDMNRPQLEAMLKLLSTGDQVHVHELSRLARSVKDLTDIVSQIVDKGASIKFHKEGLEFSADKKANPVQHLMLNMLGAIAQFERDLLLERQREGIKIAKQKGVYKGRQSKFSDHDIQRIKEEFADASDKVQLAKRWNISRSHLYNLVKS